ncbi:hypothetical protein BHE90_017027, partial [Fusarium euwallaceae]
DVLDKQIPKLDNNQDAITLSIGGNDVGLVSLLNSCIFQMGVFTKQQAEAAKLIAEVDKDYAWAKDFDWDSLSRGCEGQIEWTKSLATSQTFSRNLDDVLTAAKKKLATGAKIYVTGYAKFFAEDMTTECDKVTWTTWIYKLANLGQPAEYLTRARRTSLNLLVDTVNSQLEAAVARAGDSVRFIHFDPFVGKYGGRYCEPGVDESTSESNTRKGLMFYELNSWDPAGTSPWKRETDGGELSGTLYGDMLILAQITRLLDPDAELHHDNGNNELASKRELAARADIFDYLVPNGYARVFHPQIALHKMIASLVIYEIMMDHQVRTGYAVWTPASDNKACEPGNEETPPDEDKEVWQVLIYEKESECIVNDDTRYRLIWGSEFEKCYTFADPMPGTGCAEYRGNEEQNGCVGAGLVPRSLRVPNKATCYFYYGALCSSHYMTMPDHSCIDGELYLDQILSFKCSKESTPHS